jgi:hypothetical protein
MVKLAKLEQPLNKLLDIADICVGSVILDKPLHPWKAEDPIIVTAAGIDILVRLEQPCKQELPNDATFE